MPHSTTGISPNDALNNRKLTTTLPEMPSVRLPQHEDIATNDAKKKNRIKDAAGEKTYAREHSIKPGDTVLVRQQKQNKLSTPFNPKPFIVKEKKGTIITALNGSERITRNSFQFKIISNKLNQGKSPIQEAQREHPGTTEREQPKRNIRRPAWLSDYVE